MNLPGNFDFLSFNRPDAPNFRKGGPRPLLALAKFDLLLEQSTNVNIVNCFDDNKKIIPGYTKF
jgi:hypothetical protein